MAELLGGELHEIHMQVRPVAKALALLSPGWQVEAEDEGQAGLGWLLVSAEPDRTPAIVKALVEGGVEIHQVTHRRQSLEQLFLALTNGEVGASHA